MKTILAALLLLGSNALGSNLIIEKGPKIKSSLGYSVRWPKDYMGLRDGRDNGTDTVVAYPQSYKIEFSDMGDIAKIKAHNLVVMNVYPNPSKTLQELTSQAASGLKQSGQKFSISTVSCRLGSASVIRILSGPGSVTVLAVGKNASYEFIAGSYHQPLKTMLQSVVETPPDRAHR